MDTLFLIFNVARVLFILLDIALVGLLIFSVKKALPYRPNNKPTPTGGKATRTIKREMIDEQWGAIRNKFAEGTADARKVAIINADTFIDKMLRDAGIEGTHMADRLEQLAGDELKTIDRLWRAHRLRNDLVHTPEFVVSESTAEKTMTDYEAFLREIKLLS